MRQIFAVADRYSRLFPFLTLVVVGLSGVVTAPSTAWANPALIREHCATCHNETDAEGEFQLSSLGDRPTDDNLQRWLDSLDRVASEEMPPEDESRLSSAKRKELVAYLRRKLTDFRRAGHKPTVIPPRRLNNREFENSIRDVLLIEDVGTHQPTDNLIGDSLHDGFDTHGETLGFSEFHLEQYIAAVRRIVDATILSGERPESKRYEIRPQQIIEAHTSQNTTRSERKGKNGYFDFLDPQRVAYFAPFKTVPWTGRYRISIRCTGKDRGLYESEKTGVYDDDPIRLMIRMGNRRRDFNLPDDKVLEIKLDEWLAAGSTLRLQHPTDGLRMRGNGNFKFQNAIAGEYLKKHDPERYAAVVAAIKTKPGRKARPPQSWHHWVDDWRGPRPRVLSAVVEGPFYESWPPERQVKLIGRDPKAEDAAEILRPIAERAWRRRTRPGELNRIIRVVRSMPEQVGDIEALKEGIVSILVSPQFLLLNQEDATAEERFASKLSFFLSSTIPDPQLSKNVADGKLESFDGVRFEVQRRISEGQAEPFLRSFPYGWLKLNDINFMAPDPDHFHHFHRKRVSEDMIGEVLHFFRHAVEQDIPVPELISADYSFVNADLAKVYGLKHVPQDSTFRNVRFADGRRGGLLGTGAFLTITADSLSTSPIHRAIYVMENFLGIHPTPPPPDVQIAEPDVREATTIKEILNRHRSDPNCASCHKRIDPFGYAFENFDPSGAWRDVYTITSAAPSAEDAANSRKRSKFRSITIPIDAGARFRDGSQYQDIVEYRRYMLTDVNRDRFVRCFISKLLTYANGVEPDRAEFAEVDRILAKSAQHEYRIVETIAAVIDSPLFRER